MNAWKCFNETFYWLGQGYFTEQQGKNGNERESVAKLNEQTVWGGTFQWYLEKKWVE